MTLVVPFEEAERNNLVKIISEQCPVTTPTHPEILDETITEEQLANKLMVKNVCSNSQNRGI